MTKQRLILAALLCCLAFSASYAWKRFPRQQSTGKPQTGVGAASTEASTPPALSKRGQVATTSQLALPEPPSLPLQIKRDLFQAPAEKRTAANTGKARHPLPSPPPPPPPPPPPSKQDLARRELQQYRVMGFLKHEGRHTAFVTNGNKVQLVHTGDMLTAAYKVTKISGYRLVVRSEDGDELQLSGR